MVARLLSGVLNVSANEIASKLAGPANFVWIARKLPPEKVERIKEMNLRGIYFGTERQRFYPKQTLAAHVLGYVNIDEKGLGGIEYSLDSKIRGLPGRMVILADAHSRPFDSSEQRRGSGIECRPDVGPEHSIHRGKRNVEGDQRYARNRGKHHCGRYGVGRNSGDDEFSDV